MKKNLFSLLFALLVAGNALAIPAHPGPVSITQPDGSTLTIRLHGDEYLHFNTTDDGYSVVKRADGFYAYATLDARGHLQATDRIARNAGERTPGEEAWLQAIGKQTPTMTEANSRERMAEKDRQAKARQAAEHRASLYDYNNFRGLLLLVQFNDREFSRPDYADVINDMVNKENYTGYDNSTYGRYTGSVRDYFYDNSDGQFSPQFDVVGPVTIDYSQYDANATANAAKLILAAVDAADSLVNYKLYDRDGDGTVELVYFIFAGIGSNIGGNDSRLIWPHRSIIYNPNGGGWNWQVVRDGVTLYDYACSTELYGTNSWSILDGIGVISHEFSHVLGLPDLYDTDYEQSNGQSAHPADWCIMASGGYLNNGRTPAGYSLYERYAVGFTTPQLLTEEGHYILPAIGSSNMGYRLNTPVSKEFFLFENRQKSTKWDRHLPGSGMLVFRVDSTNTNVWRGNNVNANPNHNYFQLLRAGGSSGQSARASDPFPGTGRVTMLNNSTSPSNLLSWAGRPCVFGLDNIKETNGNVEFDLIDVNVLKKISLPGQLSMGVGLNTRIPETRYPEYAPCTLKWSSTDDGIATVNDLGVVTPRAIGEVDITVTANDDPNLTATCHVTVENKTVFSSIEEFKSAENTGSAALLLNNALVHYIRNNDVYIHDASGAIIFSGTGLSLQVGDCLNGYVYGNLAVKNGVSRLEAVEGMTNDNGYTLTSDNEVKPREIELSDLSAAYYGDLITLKAVMAKVDGGVWVSDDSHRIRLYNTFQVKNLTAPATYEGKFFDVTGLYQTNVLKGELIDELTFVSKSPFVEVDAPTGIAQLSADKPDDTTQATIFTTDGRKVAETTVGAIRQQSLPGGIYIVKTAEKAWRIVK